MPIMNELRYLELFNCELTTAGLSVILDNCPLLESLHITGLSVGRMKKNLRERCGRLKEVTLPAHELAGNSDELAGNSSCP